MAKNKVSKAFHLVIIFSLLVISMVESRTLSDILEKYTKSTKAEASSRLDKLNGALPTNLKPDTKAPRIRNIRPTSSSKLIRTTDDELSDAKALPTSSLKPIRTTDATPISVANSMMRTSLSPVTNYSQTSELEENLETVEESTEYVKSTQVTNQPKGTDTVETGDSDSMIISSQPEMMNHTESSVLEETPKTNTESTENVKKVPRAIGAHVFFGKMVSGAEMYNMTTDEYLNQIYPTHNCDVFLIGKLLKVADTPHNRMIFAKFADEETESTSDDSTEQDVAID